MLSRQITITNTTAVHTLLILLYLLFQVPRYGADVVLHGYSKSLALDVINIAHADNFIIPPLPHTFPKQAPTNPCVTLIR